MFVIQVDPRRTFVVCSVRGKAVDIYQVPGIPLHGVYIMSMCLLYRSSSVSEAQHTNTNFLRWIELTMMDHISSDDKASVRFVRPCVAPQTPDL